MSLLQTIDQLTAGVVDASSKTALRPVLEAELLKLGNKEEDVASALDEFYKRTLQ